MKIAFSTTCTDGYVVFLKPMLKSLIYNNPGFDYDYLIWTNGSITKEDEECLKSIYPKIKFIRVEVSRYANLNKGVKYFSFECFFPRGYDKIIYNGADMLCLRSVQPIVNFEVGDRLGLQVENRRPGQYNNGCMIVPKNLMTVDNFNALMTSNYDYSHIFGTDQKAIQLYFKTRLIKTDNEFNTLLSEIDFVVKKKIIFLHYIYKPNTVDFLTRSSKEYLDLWGFYENMPIEQVKTGNPKAGIIEDDENIKEAVHDVITTNNETH